MRKGDVWLINLDPTIGAEIKKTRFLEISQRLHYQF
jgi:mRNA-degrading endonuclease toxin of MazEF toxin-antitoxin module